MGRAVTVADSVGRAAVAVTGCQTAGSVQIQVLSCVTSCSGAGARRVAGAGSFRRTSSTASSARSAPSSSGIQTAVIVDPQMRQYSTYHTPSICFTTSSTRPAASSYVQA